MAFRSDITDIEGVPSPPVKRTKLSGGLRSTLSNVRTDWETVIAQGAILHRNYSRHKGDDSKIRYVLKYIFQPEATQLLVWETIRLNCGNYWKAFSGIVRRLSMEHMWIDYRDRAGLREGAGRDICGCRYSWE